MLILTEESSIRKKSKGISASTQVIDISLGEQANPIASVQYPLLVTTLDAVRSVTDVIYLLPVPH
jgi:hypothetical protein